MPRRRRTVVAVPLPIDAEDMAQVLADIGATWVGLRVELDPEKGELLLTASRRRPPAALSLEAP